MPRFAKKVGFVGGNDVNQVDEFAFSPFGGEHVIAILSVRRDIEAAQPALEPDLHHGFLVRVQVDARFVIDERAQPLEVGFGEPFIPGTHGVN
jgi:hypothetical protein